MKRSLWAWPIREAYLEKTGYDLGVSHCPVVVLSQLSPKVTQIHWVIPPFLRACTCQSGICRCPPDTLH